MDFKNLKHALISLVSCGPTFFVALTTTFLWLLLLLFRRPLVRLFCRVLGLAQPKEQALLLSRIDSPLQMLFILLAGMPALAFMPDSLKLSLGNYVTFASWILFIHIVIQWIYNLSLFWYMARNKDQKIPAVVLSLIMTVTYAMAVLWLLNLVFNINVVPFLATSTVITAVIGLSMQDTLRNIFAGLTVSLEHSFHQGDWIMFRQDQTNTLVGEVIEVGWRSTKIRSVNNNYIIIPNAQFTNNELINYNFPTAVHAREITFPVSLAANGDEIKAEIEKVAACTEGVLDKPAPQAFATAMTIDYMTYQLRLWLGSYDVREKVTGCVLERVRKRLIELNALSGKDS